MVLKEQELLQMDEEFIRTLLEKDPDALAGLSINLVNDLKEALERLNQNPSNSSKPSGSLAPWDKGSRADDNEDNEDLNIEEKEALRSESDKDQPSDETTDKVTEEAGTESSLQSENTEKNKSRKPGRQTGSQGFGRTQKLEVTDTQHHLCGCCTVCNEDLASVAKAYTGFQTININLGDSNSPGVQLSNIQHIYYTGLCPNCGLENRSEPWRAPADTSDWKNVGMTEWRLVGPD